MNEPTAAANPDSAQDLTANMDASEDINTTTSGDTPDADSSALAQMDEDPQIVDIKLTLIDAAELAGRAGVQAAKAGADMHAAAKDLAVDHATQRKHGIVVLSVFAVLVVMGLLLFGVMSIRLQQRINQLDAMLLAVGKRVIAMDESLKLVNNSGEVFQAIAERQDTISRQQVKLDTRVEDLMKAAQSAIQTNAQTIDTQGKDNAKRTENTFKHVAGGPDCGPASRHGADKARGRGRFAAPAKGRQFCAGGCCNIPGRSTRQCAASSCGENGAASQGSRGPGALPQTT